MLEAVFWLPRLPNEWKLRGKVPAGPRKALDPEKFSLEGWEARKGVSNHFESARRRREAPRSSRMGSQGPWKL